MAHRLLDVIGDEALVGLGAASTVMFAMATLLVAPSIAAWHAAYVRQRADGSTHAWRPPAASSWGGVRSSSSSAESRSRGSADARSARRPQRTHRVGDRQPKFRARSDETIVATDPIVGKHVQEDAAKVLAGGGAARHVSAVATIGGVLVGMVQVEEREADEADDEAADSHGQQPIVIDGGRRRESAESLASQRPRPRRAPR